jgi:corrinoid protein of di/trimethylamine methyltransferase
MKTFEEIAQAMSQAVATGDDTQAAAVAREALAAGVEPHRVFEQIIAPTLTEIGDRFQRLEIFLPEMMMAADAAKAVFAVLQPAIEASKTSLSSQGRIVIGTVAGDVHDIGKNMVASMLEVNGFEVINLGCDVPPDTFLRTAREKQADIIAMSSLLTTSLPYMKDVLEVLHESGEAARFKVMVGGGPVTAEWAQQVGADGYGKDAAEAVTVARRLLQRK